MKKRLIFFLKISVAAFLGFNTYELQAQVSIVDSLAAEGNRLRESYRFDEAVATYWEALERLDGKDSIAVAGIKENLLLAENGRSMTGFVYSPVVVARHMFSLEDFFLYYPLKDKSWRKAPNQLDLSSGPYAKAIYAPAEDKTIYYSAADQDGIRNIYKTSLAGQTWSQPSLLNEYLTSDSDEIYPVVSPDGSRLYFASKGLYGVGGYDLYVSELDKETGDWSVPVNMGFPYSSPFNDFLLVDSEDGKYTLFASDRGCPKDSVYLYVLEYDSMPVRGVVDDPEKLSRLSQLEPGDDLHDVNQTSSDVKSEIPENVDTRRYMDKMARVRLLRDSIALCEKNLVAFREKYSILEDEVGKRKLEEEILRTESMMPLFRARLDVAVKQLQEVEMDFLFSGVVIDPDHLLAEADREIISKTPEYAFRRMSMGEPLTLEVEVPEPKFDYSFKILDRGQFAEDNTIPSGIVYQIQIFSVSSRASVKSLKGLSPVFESRSSTGRYIYRVGLFNTYSDVLARLNKVKKVGFKSAYIVAYVDGKEMSVNKVRTIESERAKAAPVLYRVKIVSTGGEIDSVAMDGIRQQASGKDIARVGDGLIIGPFDNDKDASALIGFVNAMGYGKAELEVINH